MSEDGMTYIIRTRRNRDSYLQQRYIPVRREWYDTVEMSLAEVDPKVLDVWEEFKTTTPNWPLHNLDMVDKWQTEKVARELRQDEHEALEVETGWTRLSWLSSVFPCIFPTYP